MYTPQRSRALGFRRVPPPYHFSMKESLHKIWIGAQFEQPHPPIEMDLMSRESFFYLRIIPLCSRSEQLDDA